MHDSSDPARATPSAAPVESLSPWTEPGEHAVWAGRPSAEALGRVRPRLILFGVFWTVVSGSGFYGFAATWFSDEFAGLGLGMRVAILAVGAAPFVLVALWTLGLHAPLAALKARSTLYGVTDRRVLVVRPFPWPWSRGRCRSLALDRAEFTVDHHDVTGAGIEVHDRRQIEPPLDFAALVDAEHWAQVLADRVPKASPREGATLAPGSHPADGTTP